MPKSDQPKSIKFKKDLKVLQVGTFERFAGNRPNFEKLCNLFVDTLAECPDFLPELTTEAMMELTYQEFDQLAVAFRELKNELSQKPDKPVKVGFVDKVLVKHIAWLQNATTGVTNYHMLAMLLEDVINKFDKPHTKSDILEWDYQLFSHVTLQYAEYANGITSKN